VSELGLTLLVAATVAGHLAALLAGRQRAVRAITRALVRDLREGEVVNLVGKVVEVSPPTRLVITWANPAQADDPAATSRVSFDVEAYDDMVRLTVTHEDLQAGSGMDQGIRKGWPIVLSSLKSLLETGRGIDVFAKAKAAA